MSNLFKLLIEEITKMVSKREEIIPVVQPQDDGGTGGGGGGSGQSQDGQEVKEVGKKPGDKQKGKGSGQSDGEEGEEKEGGGGGEGEGDGKGEDGEGEGEGGSGGGEESEGEGGGQGGDKAGDSQKKSKKGAKVGDISQEDGEEGQDGQPGQGQGKKPSNKKQRTFDHVMDRDDGSAKDIIERAYEWYKNSGQEGTSKAAGSESGGYMEAIEAFLDEVTFPIDDIKQRLQKFKRLFNPKKQKQRSWPLWKFGVMGAGDSNVLRPANPKLTVKDKESAILIFAVDTSGSMGPDEFGIAYGILNDIAKSFKNGDVKGEAYVLNWDTTAHLPIIKWDHMTESKFKNLAPEEAERLTTVKGRGGTGLQQVFIALDKLFVKKDNDGDYYFIWHDKHKAFNEQGAVDVDWNKEEAEDSDLEKLGGEGKEAVIEKLNTRDQLEADEYEEDDDLTVKKGIAKVKKSKMSKVPFIVVFTDGYFATPDINSSKLYKNAKGNILYLLTERHTDNLSPKNYAFIDMKTREIKKNKQKMSKSEKKKSTSSKSIISKAAKELEDIDIA